ncbi:hypothetical protein Pdw03_2290 [Penicillium digitatum]|uniref:Uncharacterized protein n=3 Tax=Penicillium digitatum TaxID=36651 RepID=K9GSR7_PEND2|nr:hypothetical protein PDIP_24300 [Penicillium digitatum Pd1]EKV16136.1 hypothetical protein PDIG_22020 [Penicillium digitatum PHI26]EKV19332.1 hypothetical protein PDIP_24300 [Penicillium digitatum Pd1]KAG0153570.1 hypothetical protein PDIDSM_2224 [Penicillium digitatum]QQK47392.1 hypothetical protein Pdw03_2290 [Penicillium digitatum]
MDSTLRTPYKPHASLAQPTTSFHSSSSTLSPSAGRSNMEAQAQSTLEVASNATRQVFSSPSLQSACSPQTSASPMQSLSQAFGNTSNPSTLPLAPAANTQAFLPMNAAPAPAPTSDAYPHQIHGLGGPTATAPFLQDFNLVAEAAKRAQIGIVMRDLESVTL